MMIQACSSSVKLLEVPETELPDKYKVASFEALPDLLSGLSNNVLLHHIGAINAYNECSTMYKGLLDFY